MLIKFLLHWENFQGHSWMGLFLACRLNGCICKSNSGLFVLYQLVINDPPWDHISMYELRERYWCNPGKWNGAWVTYSCELLMHSGPDNAWFQMYHFHLQWVVTTYWVWEKQITMDSYRRYGNYSLQEMHTEVFSILLKMEENITLKINVKMRTPK